MDWMNRRYACDDPFDKLRRILTAAPVNLTEFESECMNLTLK